MEIESKKIKHVIEGRGSSGGVVFVAEYRTREEMDAAYYALAALFGSAGDAAHNYNCVWCDAHNADNDKVVFSARTYL